MSGQWEVVGKRKERSNSKLPLPKHSSKQDVKNKQNVNLLNGVKLEEVLPKAQVKSLYASPKSNKENSKPQDKNKNQNNVSKKHEKIKPKAQEPPKAKPPKSIESALNSINVEEFRHTLEQSEALYPDAPIVWLKEMVKYLNQKIPVEVQDPVFSNKSQGYPLNVVSPGIKSVIEKSVKDAGRTNAQLYFDIALTSMVTDMSKGLPGTGYRFYLQHIALTEPKLVISNINKHVTLRNSYQNRANVALSILWAVGCVGINDFHSGLTVFEELMLPLIDMRNYSTYVAQYLSKLLSSVQEVALSKEEYLVLLDSIFSCKKYVPSVLQNELHKKAPSLKSSLFRNNRDKLPNYVDFLLKKINSCDNKLYKDCLCDVLVAIFNKDQSALAHWNKVASKNVAGSAVLLEHIDKNYTDVSKIINKMHLKDFLENLSSVFEELCSKKKKDEGLKCSLAHIRNIKGKMVQKRTKSFTFTGLLCCFLVMGTVSYAITNAYTGGVVDDAIKKMVAFVESSAKYVDSRFAEQFPHAREIFWTSVNQYGVLLRDLRKIGCNYIHDIAPVIRESIDSYAPGLVENTQHVVRSAYSISFSYANKTVEYLSKEVFVGQLAPAHIQKVVRETVDVVFEKSTTYYHWLYEKIHSSIK